MCTLKEHNFEPYIQIVKMFDMSKLCLYVSATGTGKSYIAASLIDDFCYRTLILVPALSIGDQWKELTNADILTYQAFSKYGNNKINKICKKYDLIILDESHHIGAPVWRTNILNIIKNYNIRVFGLTATPERYSDNYDIIQEVFKGNVVYGYSLSEAIELGILPPFDYIPVIYSDSEYNKILKEKLLDKIKSDRANKLIGKLDYLGNKDMIKNILTKHINNMERKILVFIPQISDIFRVTDLFNEIFKDAAIYSIHSKKSRNDCKEEIKMFQQDQSKISILISVNMLNEGLHIKNADTIVMLRKTGSPIILFQQLGRVLSSSNINKKILVFDLVNNKNNVNPGSDQKSLKKYKQDNSNIITRIKAISNQNIIYDYTMEGIEVLEEIYSILNNVWIWSKEEDDILKEWYPIEGPEVYKRLPGRSKAACINRARRLGLKFDKSWKKKEDNYLKKEFPRIGEAAFDNITRHSKEDCWKRVRRLKLTDKFFWTHEEDKIVIEKYYKLRMEDLMKLLPGRSEQAIKMRVYTLKYKGLM